MKKKRKLIKTFFGLLYIGAMSLPLVVGLYNFIKEWHDTNAVNNQTSALLDGESLLDVFGYSNVEKFVDVIGSSYEQVNNFYSINLKTFSDNASQYSKLGSGRFKFSDISININTIRPSNASELSPAVLSAINNVSIYKGNPTNQLLILKFYADDTVMAQWYYSSLPSSVSNTFTFRLLEILTFSEGSYSSTFNTHSMYMIGYYPVSTASIVPSNAEKFLDYDAIVQSTIADSHMDDLNIVVDIDFVGLFGAVYDSAIWVFLNSYINYIINMALITFMPEIILLFIQWCRDLVYTFTDKQEGGF